MCAEEADHFPIEVVMKPASVEGEVISTDLQRRPGQGCAAGCQESKVSCEGNRVGFGVNRKRALDDVAIPCVR
jgi:hypothetical protein